MYFARSRLLLLFLLIWLGGLVEVASAQHRYIFPQFAFGGGWESTLTAVSGVNDNTTCTFSAQGRFLTMRDHLGNSRTGTALTLQGAFNFLKTETPGQAASSGMAVLDCNNEVIAANTLFSLEVGGSLVGEALVESAEEVVAGPDSYAWFPADHRGGSRFGVAVANPSPQPLDMIVTMFDTGMQTIVNATVNVPANTSKAFFVDELGTVPPDLFGQVLISPSNNSGPSLYAVGLRFTGLVFTTIPAIVYPRPTATATASPPNDLFSNARTISGSSGRATGSNVGATVEPDEPGSGSSSVWWQWRAPSSGTVTIDTIGSNFDTILGVYTGTRVDALSTLGEDDDGVEVLGSSRVTLTVTAGTVYMLRVSGFGFLVSGFGFGDGEGSIVLNWNPGSSTASPPNDLFSNALTISGQSGRSTGSNIGATVETGEPGLGTHSVWWQWRAASSGAVTIDTAGSSFDTTLGVYTGTSVGALRTLAEDDDGAVGVQSRVTLDVTAGTVYRLRIGGYNGVTGNIVLNWNPETATPPPVDTGDPWSRSSIERFRGTWQFTYTKNGVRTTETFVLNIVVEQDDAPGEWGIGGIQDDGSIAALFYSRNFDSYGLISVVDVEADVEDVEEIYIFSLTSPTTVSGCYYQIDYADDFVSNCFPMTGVRTSSSTSALSSTTSALPYTTEVDPAIIKVIERLREVLRQ